MERKWSCSDKIYIAEHYIVTRLIIEVFSFILSKITI